MMANLSRVRDINLQVNALYNVSHNFQLRFGTGLIRHLFKPDVIEYSSNLEQDFRSGSGSIESLEGSVYVENELKFSKGTSLNLGMHGSGYCVGNKRYYSLQPRMSFDWIPARNFHINTSYTRMSLYVHLLTNSGVGMPTDLWVPVTDRIKPLLSEQFTLGMLWNFSKTYTLSVEGYYKKMWNLIEYRAGAHIADKTIDWQDKIETGNGQAYGLEFLIQKRLGKFTGWAGYTLSRSLRQFKNLNQGNPFPYKYDRIHDLSVTASYKPNQRIEIGASWIYGTGIAFTAPAARYPTQDDILFNWPEYNNHTIIGFSERNAARYPDYHRLDLSIQFKKQKKWGERSWIISIFNVYNRKNPFYLKIKDGGRLPNTSSYSKFLEMHSWFQIIPSVSYRFVF